MSDTKKENTPPPKSDPLADRKDESGNIIDPPVIPAYEERLAAAANAGDTLLLAEIQAEYNKEREREVKRALTRDAKRKEVN